MAGLVPKTTGHLTLHSNLYGPQARFNQLLGYCPQDNPLPSNFTLSQLCRIFLWLSGDGRMAKQQRITHLLNQFKLTHIKSTPLNHLSSGVKRKVLMCLSLVKDPLVLLLDEPTSGLDEADRKEICSILHSLK